MTEVISIVPAIAQYLETIKGKSHVVPALQSIADSAMPNWEKMPQSKDEEWKYLNLKPLYQIAWSVNHSNPEIQLVKDHLEHLSFYSSVADHMVFINGLFHAELSSVSLDKGIQISDLHSAFNEEGNPNLRVDDMAKGGQRDQLTALNQSVLDNGLYLNVEPNKAPKAIFVYQFTTGSEAIAVHPRNVIHLQNSAEAEITEYYAHLGSASSWFNPITEIRLQANAKLKHTLLQTDSSLDFFTGLTYVHQENHSVIDQNTFTFEGTLVRNNLELVLEGTGVEGNMNGLYMLTGNTVVDNHTLVDHRKPNSLSNELYKGIMDGTSTGVFNGKIFVRQDAQKTNAYQSNKNILLSGDATVDTKPQLEIYADDVKCSHGATTGQLDDESLFYLRSRGLGLDEAKALLTKAFASEIVEKLKNEKVRLYLEGLIENRFKK